MSEYTDYYLVLSAADSLAELRGQFEAVVQDASIMPLTDLAMRGYRDYNLDQPAEWHRLARDAEGLFAAIQQPQWMIVMTGEIGRAHV